MIQVRKNNEFAKRASLHGISLEVKNVRRVYEKLDEKTKDRMIDIHQAAIQRKVAEKTAKRR